MQLKVPILGSLRAGHIKPQDLEFYRSLSRPLVRALYRQLDALHFDEPTEDGLSNKSFQVGRRGVLNNNRGEEHW